MENPTPTRRVFPDTREGYAAAYEHARQCADWLQMSIGIEAASEYGKRILRTQILPPPHQRFGYEARIECVNPGSPRLV